MEKKYVIYTISLQGKVMYVGKTGQFKKRKYDHMNFFSGKIPKDIDLSLVSINVIDEFDEEDDAYKAEGKYILQYDTINNGWNKYRSGLIERGREKDYFKERHKENAETFNERSKKWYDENKEHHKKTNYEYRQNHLEEQRKYQREWKRKKYALKKAEKLLQEYPQ